MFLRVPRVSGGYEPFPVFLDSVDSDFAFSLYELDWDVFGVHIEGAMHRLPVLETTGTVCAALCSCLMARVSYTAETRSICIM